MSLIDLNNTTHKFSKNNLITKIGRVGNWDNYECSLCGMKGKRYGVGNYLTVRGKIDKTFCPKVENKAGNKFAVGKEIIVTNYTGFIKGDGNLTKDSIHKIIETPNSYTKKEIQGVWVMGEHKTPLLLLFGEFELLHGD